MRKNFGFFLGAGALLGAALVSVRATEPTRQPWGEPVSVPSPTPEPDKPPETGKVLVLENERTLTGDIERRGNQFRIKRLTGETWIPAGQALKLCSSLEEAHQFLQSRTNLNDIDERLRLADWCRQHGLLDLALEEARAASALQPENDRAKRLVGYLVDARAKATAPPRPPEPEKTLPHVDITAESLTLFATRVQPILINACASCHNPGRGGNFQLIRTYGASLGSRRSLDQNLAVALAYVNPRDPQMSRLLTKAISLHAGGMVSAPLRGRQAAAYRTLERWVQETLSTNPQLRDTLPQRIPHAQETCSASAAPVLTLPPPPTTVSGSWGEGRAPDEAVKETPPAPPERPVRQAASSDPVDPEGFNREFHPEKNPETPK
jgi:hypothetical protein